MWLITRNKNEILNVDGSWGYSMYSSQEDWLLFGQREDAESHAEDLGMSEFVRLSHLNAVFHEKYERQAASKFREKGIRENCEYIPLLEPLKFHPTTHEDDLPTFEIFHVTHYVVSNGMLYGVLGYGEADHSGFPLRSITGDEFDWSFCEVYQLAKETMEQPKDDSINAS